MNLTGVKTCVAVILVVALLPVCAGAVSDRLDLSIPMVLPEQKSITIYDSKNNLTMGTYNTETGSLFLSGPNGKVTNGTIDAQGNLFITETGGDNSDD